MPRKKASLSKRTVCARKQRERIEGETEADAINYPTEFLNSLDVSGMPPHLLELKIGSVVTLLRNLDPPKLCNGTRLLIKNFINNVIEATILTGFAVGEDDFIPRIPLITTNLPFALKRLQFPLRLSFAMTINKSQGQSLKTTGLFLSRPCFSHGQLYVGCKQDGCLQGGKQSLKQYSI